MLWDACALGLPLLYSGYAHQPYEFHQAIPEVNVELPPLLELQHLGTELVDDFVVEGGVGVGG